MKQEENSYLQMNLHIIPHFTLNILLFHFDFYQTNKINRNNKTAPTAIYLYVYLYKLKSLFDFKNGNSLTYSKTDTKNSVAVNVCVCA